MTKKSVLISLSFACITACAVAAFSLLRPVVLPESPLGTTPRGALASPASAANNLPSTRQISVPASQSSTAATQTFSYNGKAFPMRYYKPLASTSNANDPSSNQWWTSAGLNQSWALPTGTRQTTVAVIDTGMALAHEEFTDRWATNNLEQGTTTIENPSTTKQKNCTAQGLALSKSCNMVDDDGNGYVDDVTGWDFISDDNAPQAGQVNPIGGSVSHATNVASVLGATGNNGKGVAGVDWSTKILPLQALGDNEDGTTLTVSRAIYYAVERGVDVINLSLGTDQPDEYLRQAIDYAMDNNVAVVAAAGNVNCDCMSYPAQYPEVIAVGAQAQAGGRASFSSYGTNLDLVAPGERMTLASFSATNTSALYESNLNGTSFAAPYISGLLSRSRSIMPAATWAELIANLQSKADKSVVGSSQLRNNTLGSGPARPFETITRLRTPIASEMRYGFSVSNVKHPFTSQRVYQCEPGESPSVTVSALQRTGMRDFSISSLQKHKSVTAGWTLGREFNACVGLPNDSVAMQRILNLNAEFYNDYDSKYGLEDTSSPHGKSLYVNAADAISNRPMAITSKSQAAWLTGDTNTIQQTVNQIVTEATKQKSLATVVLYNIPQRDCGSYSAGGAASSNEYRLWAQQVAAGIGNRQAIVIIEPDALASINCLTTAEQDARYADLSYVSSLLSEQTNTYVYMDAGNSTWIGAEEMGIRLRKAGVAKIRGFSLNVSNFETNISSNEYGSRLSGLLGGAAYVVDSSRNGRGPGDTWCNPLGRGLGTAPTTSVTGNLDAYLWIKRPGESDGSCNGGPAAGSWWQSYAEGLVTNAAQ